ncbi:zf-DHHC domain-containing protein [Cephalotus follicularis]|uniref:S-acyltransferase n=1 Tax=Cephalotus follicularis TaxID=3775 RepID=A0A1Q3BGF3_CEPFO|nr:zf-DHHC domain-containing protein [Cephalotus follicularis]
MVGGIEKKSQVQEKLLDRKHRSALDFIGHILIVIKKFLHDQWLLYVRGDNSKTTRMYHIWPGNNVFFFHGRLICGPDPRGLLSTTVSIFLSNWVFAVYVSDIIPNHSTLIISLLLILKLIVLMNLIVISAIDPGIIPRNDGASIEEVGTSNGNKRKRVSVNGVELKLKYCRICRIFRPPRSCHCAVCDNCVEKFDHHCPWIGQCIALRNYRFYMAFVISALIFFIYIFVFSCWRIHQRMLENNTGLLRMLGNFPETLALALFSFMAICFLGGLTVFHVYLVAVNQTAYENYYQSFLGSRNPYDKGILSNVKEVLCVPLPSSRVDFRAEVTSSWHANTGRQV